MRADKSDAIPADLAPILELLDHEWQPAVR
jgi:hypothetical protein